MVTQHPPDPVTESFAGLLLRHRGRTGLTQRDVATRLGTSRRSVQDWESGAYYPSAERLQALILVLLESGGLTVGRERIEAHELWVAALREAPRMHTPFDQEWLDQVLAERAAAHTAIVAAELSSAQPATQPADAGGLERRQDWGEAPEVIGFVGRAEELARLHDWVLEERCRLAAVLGMGGIGKTALAARLAQDAAPHFQRVYWRSLRDALPAGEWMAGAIGFLSAHHLVPPEGESARLAALLQLLRDQPSLLVLDNFETVLEPGQPEGSYREGLAGYGALLRAIGETRHQSCVVMTSRETPPELAVLGGGAVRELQLGGLSVAEGQVLLADKQLSGTDEDWANLIVRFGGNGLALKVVGESILQVFDGDISAFLSQGSGSLFGGIRRLLAEQIERSSALEQKLLRVLAVERESVSLAELITDLGPRVRQAAVLDAVEALRRRSLVERAGAASKVAFTLQSVVLEYVTDRLVEEVAGEIARGQPVQLVGQPLIKAQAKDDVRQTEEHLIGEAILRQLQMESGDRGAEQLLLALLGEWRSQSAAEQGYGPGNVVNLLRLLRGDLRGVDLSALSIRQAYLAGVEAQDASLAGAHAAETVLGDAFEAVTAIAVSADGTRVAAGTIEGEVRVWRVADRTPLLSVRGHAGPVQGVALSADGQTVASGGYDGAMRLWATGDGRSLATLEGHTGGVIGMALSADGRTVAGGGQDGAVWLWAAGDGRPLATLEGHTAGVWGVAVSADGKTVASSSQDRSVRLWDAERQRCLAVLEGHTAGAWG
ncbi:MAG TPA: helix-turn-helix domain-containing protein, partial [Chloroflexota bacterium]|nr:helix-turn-helix domain-containing protein [Chloroflexota bacterium]